MSRFKPSDPDLHASLRDFPFSITVPEGKDSAAGNGKKEKQTQQNIKKNRNALQLALEAGRQGIWEWDAMNDKIRWIGNEREYTGNKDEAVRNIYPGDRQKFGLDLKKALEKKGRLETEFRVQGRRGETFWMSIKGQVLSDDLGRPVKMTGVTMNITESKKAQEEISHRERKFRAIFETAQDAIIIADDYMRIKDANPAASGLLGYKPYELIKMGMGDIAVSGQPLDMMRMWEQFLKKGVQGGELDIVRADGRTRTVGYRASANILPNRHLWVLRDVTDQKIEERRSEHFLSIAGHELRSPLTSIKAYIQLLRRQVRGKEDKKLGEYLDKADKKADMLASFISDLMDVTMIRQGKLEFNPERFDYDHLVQEIIKDFRLSARTHKLIRTGRCSKRVMGDKTRISQVLVNLIKNAVKYSPGADTVRIKVATKPGIVETAVQDFGLGIRKSELRGLFDIYFRGSDERKKAIAGMGVGLYLSSEIVHQHGGKMWVKSREGHGSIFYFTLPVEGKARKYHRLKG